MQVWSRSCRAQDSVWDEEAEDFPKRKMRAHIVAVMAVVCLATMLQIAASEEMTEEQVAEARDKALASLEKPLEKMKIKELLTLLSERGVTCKNCKGAEKSHIVAQVVMMSVCRPCLS